MDNNCDDVSHRLRSSANGPLLINGRDSVVASFESDDLLNIEELKRKLEATETAMTKIIARMSQIVPKTQVSYCYVPICFALIYFHFTNFLDCDLILFYPTNMSPFILHVAIYSDNVVFHCPYPVPIHLPYLGSFQRGHRN